MPFLDEVAAKLVAAGVGTLGANIFLGSKAVIPPDDGPYLSLIETGGTGPTRVHNEATAHTQRPTAQIVARAKSYSVARAKVKEAYDALDGLFNVTLSGTFYQKITARQEPTDIGLDAASRPMIAFNVDAEKQRS
jgi:hypothetical protein